MLRADVARLEASDGTVTIAVRGRGAAPADIVDVLDVAAELLAVVDRERPDDVLIVVDEPLGGRPAPKGAIGSGSGTPFGVAVCDE